MNRIRGNLISYGHVLFLGFLTGLTGFLFISRSMNVLVFDLFSWLETKKSIHWLIHGVQTRR